METAYYARPEADIVAFERALRGTNPGGGVDGKLLREAYRTYRVAQILARSVDEGASGAYSSILDELFYTFKCDAKGLISEDEFVHGTDNLMIDLDNDELEYVQQYMADGNGGGGTTLAFSRFEEGWEVADRLANLRAERKRREEEEANAASKSGRGSGGGSGGSPGSGSGGGGVGSSGHASFVLNDVVLSTQPKARRDRASHNQQWGIHQPGFETVGQWRLCRNESVEWQKQALVWPTPPHLGGAFNEELHWPVCGVLVSSAPWENENDALTRRLPRTAAKVPTALVVRVAPNSLANDSKAYDKSVLVQVPLALIEGGRRRRRKNSSVGGGGSGGGGDDDASSSAHGDDDDDNDDNGSGGGGDGDGDTSSRPQSPKKKGLGPLPVPTQQWLRRTSRRKSSQVGGTTTPSGSDSRKPKEDTRLGMLLAECTKALRFTVPARKLYTADGKRVRAVSELCAQELRRDGDRLQLLFASRGEKFGEGPPEPGEAAAPTEALDVHPTFGAIIYRMGEDDEDEANGRKVLAKGLGSLRDGDPAALQGYLDQVRWGC
jgi:hypothetical protein